MCRFTRIYWTHCGHYTLSNTPEHTELCSLALGPDEEIRQGHDKAPAFCHPLPEDLEELGTQYQDSERIAQTNCLYTLCDLCKQNPDISSEPRGAGSEIERPAEQFGEYTDEDSMDLAKWRDLLLSNATRAEAAIRDFEEILANNREIATTAIQSIRDERIQSTLLNRDGPERWSLFRKSYEEIECLLNAAENYMIIRMLRKFVNDLIEVVQDKLYQAGLRLSIFKMLSKSIESYPTDPKAHEAALNLHADKLMARLGHPVVPKPNTFEHLTVEMPQHIQDTITTKENVRRLSISGHASETRSHLYAPRTTFGLGKNSKALAIDLERAWNPPPERAGDLSVLRKMGENVEVTYDARLETRARLRQMGVGAWEGGLIRVQRETLGYVSDGQDDGQDECLDHDDTLVNSPETAKKLSSLAESKERMVEKEATFMGLPSEDSDDENSSGGDKVDRGQEADVQDGGSPASVVTDLGQARRSRDESGRLIKKGKWST
ncbi:hypothetical protein N0V91_003157 [Didymella pomorum]|uniref:Uncharacterized protein n=1 Tax=Didymella pomorum TaxID=749634 RepID=A0A9W8ZGZ0_9PLEO|nr:hypothetical protein N0V91_003157 [Didymella pomorum]